MMLRRFKTWRKGVRKNCLPKNRMLKEIGHNQSRTANENRSNKNFTTPKNGEKGNTMTDVKIKKSFEKFGANLRYTILTVSLPGNTIFGEYPSDEEDRWVGGEWPTIQGTAEAEYVDGAEDAVSAMMDAMAAAGVPMLEFDTGIFGDENCFRAVVYPAESIMDYDFELEEVGEGTLEKIEAFLAARRKRDGLTDSEPVNS